MRSVLELQCRTRTARWFSDGGVNGMFAMCGCESVQMSSLRCLTTHDCVSFDFPARPWSKTPRHGSDEFNLQGEHAV